MCEETLLDATRRLLKARKRSLRKISLATGLNYDWLARMSQERTNDPGVQKVQALHDYLVSQQ